ncbi:MAG: hypothetical protein V4508_14095 [Pseudomonadota bacterium]
MRQNANVQLATNACAQILSFQAKGRHIEIAKSPEIVTESLHLLTGVLLTTWSRVSRDQQQGSFPTRIS